MTSSGAVLVPADDLGYLEEGSVSLWGISENFVQRQARLDLIVAQHVGQWDRVGHRLDAFDLNLSDLGDVFQDRLELGRETGKLSFAQVQSGKLGDVSDILDRDLLVRHGSGCTGWGMEVASRGVKCGWRDDLGLSATPVVTAVTR